MLFYEIIILSLVAAINAIVVWFISWQGWRQVVNRYFVATAFFVVPWALGAAWFLAADTEAQARTALLLFYIAPMYMMLSLSLFSAVFPAENGRFFNLTNTLLFLTTCAIAAVIIYDQNLLTSAIVMNDGGLNRLIVDPLGYSMYFGYFGIVFLAAFSGFIVHLREHGGHHKQQLAYIFMGTFLAGSLSTITNLLIPLLGQTQFIWLGPTWTLFAVMTIAISIVKHQLFDIKLAAVRSVAYIGVLVTLSAVYYLVAYLLSRLVITGSAADSISFGPLNVLLALLLALLFQPVKRFFDTATTNIFYRGNYDAETLYADMSRLLASTTDLRGLLERASSKLASTLKAEQGMFFIYHSEDMDHYVSSGTPGRSHIALADAHALNRFVERRGDEVMVIDALETHDDLRRLMVSYKFAVILPLKRAGAIVGYLCLGEHRGGGYTTKDIRVLETLSDELVVAIQNALAVQEIKEMNATLEQKIDVATKELRSSNAQLRHIDEVKDEFMSMASHQLRTPLTSVKGYLSMVLEGDAGKINPQQKQLLEEAFNSSERMVRLISDFLNVSRLQTGKFIIEKAPVDLAKIAAQEVASLQVLASGHGLKVEFQQPKSECMVNADEGKIRQVIMNFIDNAIYYSRPDTTIKVTLEQVGSTYEVVVIDTGIGVPKAEQARLFQKFFRATNARSQRPDGTGVGLFLAKKVITAHSGKLIFSSIEGEGSHFGFSLPMLRDKAEK